MLLLTLLIPSIFAITNVVWRIIYLQLWVHHMLITSTLKLMKILMMILIFFWWRYGIWRYIIIYIYFQRFWCFRKQVVWIKSQFRWCNQITKPHVQRQRCVEEETIELRWNVHYSQFILTWWYIKPGRYFCCGGNKTSVFFLQLI